MTIRFLVIFGLVAGVLAVAISLQGAPARAAAGPCGTSHDAISGEEQELLGLLQSWRNSNLPVSSTLEPSGALNAAAAWFAEWQITNGTPGGHGDGYGRTWVQRAIDCGYSGTTGGQPYASGSGEGTYAMASSGGISVGPSQAISGITYPGSGVYAWTSSSGLPFKCVGVGVARNAAGTAVAWVVVVAQYPAGLPCPGGGSGGGTTATNTPTMSPTPWPTPSPTPSPTPTARADGAKVILGAGWNLTTLPPGPVEQVLARASGCYRAVYQWYGERWLRYVPGAPQYANNLQTLNGGALWIEGTAANCGLVQL